MRENSWPSRHSPTEAPQAPNNKLDPTEAGESLGGRSPAAKGVNLSHKAALTDEPKRSGPNRAKQRCRHANFNCQSLDNHLIYIVLCRQNDM